MATPAWLLDFWAIFPWWRGYVNPLCSFHATPHRWEASKGKNHRCGPCTLTCSGTPCAHSTLGLPWGSTPSKSGAYVRPIIADVARKCRNAFLATPAAFLHFLAGFLRRGGLWDRLCSFHIVRCPWRASKVKIYAVVFDHPRVWALPVPLM